MCTQYCYFRHTGEQPAGSHSSIIGATTMEQLAANIASVDINLDKDVLRQIEDIHRAQPNPCP